MKLKSIITAVITCASLASLPTIASAHQLTISNATSSEISFSVNNHCSKDIGIVYDHDIKTLTDDDFAKVCDKQGVCDFKAFKGDDCNGQLIGGVIYYLDQNSVEVYNGDANKISIGATWDAIFFTESLKK